MTKKICKHKMKPKFNNFSRKKHFSRTSKIEEKKTNIIDVDFGTAYIQIRLFSFFLIPRLLVLSRCRKMLRNGFFSTSLSKLEQRAKMFEHDRGVYKYLRQTIFSGTFGGVGKRKNNQHFRIVTWKREFQASIFDSAKVYVRVLFY